MAKRINLLTYAAALLILSSGTEMNGVECGLKNWTEIKFQYVSDYADHPAGTDSRVISMRQLPDGRIQIGILGRLQRAGTYDKPFNTISVDGGHTWQAIAKRLPWNLTENIADYIQAPSNPKRLYKRIGTNGVFITSADGGTTWKKPKFIIVDAGGKPFRTNASSRAQLSVYIQAIHPFEPETLFASFRIVGASESREHLISQPDGVYVSHDAGDHWVRFTQAVRSFLYAEPGASPLGIDPHRDEVLYALGESGILKSTDGGKTWDEVGESRELSASPALERRPSLNGEPALGAPDNIAVFQFEFDPKRPDTLYMVTSKGLFKTADGGRSWSMLDLGFHEVDAINSIAVNPVDSSQLFVGTRHGIYRSDDFGCVFQRVFPDK